MGQRTALLAVPRTRLVVCFAVDAARPWQVHRSDEGSLELAHVKGLVAALVDAAADLAEMLASGGMYHA